MVLDRVNPTLVPVVEPPAKADPEPSSRLLTPAVGTSPFTSTEEALRWLDDHIDYESTMPSRRALPTLEPHAPAGVTARRPRARLPRRST